MSWRLHLLLQAAALLCVSSTVLYPAYSAQLDPANMCRAGTGRFAADYTVCTAAINSGNHTGTGLSSLYRHRALTLRYMNECAAALDDIDKAIEVTDWSVAAWTERSKINQCLDRMPEALADASKGIEINKFDFESWRQLGISQFYLGKFEQAEKSLTRSLEQNSYNAEANAFRGFATFGLERFEDAAWDFNNVAEQQYAWNMNSLWLSLSVLRSGRDPEKSVTQAVADLDGQWPAPLAQWILNSEDSASIREQAIRAEQLESALFFMAHTALAQDKLAEARKLFKELIDLPAPSKGQPAVERVLARRALERL